MNRSTVTTGGENTTSNGVKIKIDLKQDANGNVSLQSGTNFIPSGSKVSSVSADASSVNRRWIIIGGIAVVVFLAVLVVLKKKKIL